MDDVVDHQPGYPPQNSSQSQPPYHTQNQPQSPPPYHTQNQSQSPPPYASQKPSESSTSYPTQNPPPYPTQNPPSYTSPPNPYQYPPQYSQYPQQNVAVVYTGTSGATHYGSTPIGRPWHSERVQDNVVLSIISIFFCLFLGIIATFKAYESREHARRGDIPAASASSGLARRCAIAAIFVGMCLYASIFFIRLMFIY